MKKCLLLVLLLGIFVSCETKEPEVPQHQPSSVQWKNLAGKKYVQDNQPNPPAADYDNRVLQFVSDKEVRYYTVSFRSGRRPDTTDYFSYKYVPYFIGYPFLDVNGLNFKFKDTLTIYDNNNRDFKLSN